MREIAPTADYNTNPSKRKHTGSGVCKQTRPIAQPMARDTALSDHYLVTFNSNQIEKLWSSHGKKYNILWSPVTQKWIYKLEKIQKIFTSKIKGTEEMDYHERL